MIVTVSLFPFTMNQSRLYSKRLVAYSHVRQT